MRTDLTTRWGRALDPERVLAEHPRPQLRRDSHLSLNGRWRYAITPAGDPVPPQDDGEILVPFSPEAPLSGVGRQLQPHERLTYRRRVALPDGFAIPGGRVLLHFGAVDQTCTVWLDDVQVGANQGGYLPFTIDVTDALRPAGSELRVDVRDASDGAGHASGKQRLHRGGIWYTAQSGIWQTVWLEAVPATYVERLDLVPDLASSEVEVTVHAAAGIAEVTLDGTVSPVPVGVPTRLPVRDVRPWTPDDPHLYDVEVRLGDDHVTSYFGMRSYGVGPDEHGVPRLLLNGEPFFPVGVLDQGYWPDGLLTAPSDEAVVHDVMTMKSLGFTLLRKHVKVEPLRWYHHCDRLGMLVWQDFVNGGGRYRTAAVTWPGRRFAGPLRRLSDRRLAPLLGRGPGRELFEDEWRRTVALLRNVPSLAGWVPFNEGWGQFASRRVTADLRALDPMRVIDSASGWHDQGAGDVRSLHVYGRGVRLRRRVGRRDRRTVVLSEYGGHALRVEGHVWDDQTNFGYGHEDSSAALTASFARLHADLARLVPRGLSGTVYTQLSDVEDELNGLLTYDREVLKVQPADARAALRRLSSPLMPERE